MIDSLVSEGTDSNDETYVYIVAHGLPDPNGDEHTPAHAMKFDGLDYSNYKFLAELKKINGKVVVFIESCYGGSVLNDMPGMFLDNDNYPAVDINRYTFLSSAEANMKAPEGNSHGFSAPTFTESLIKALDANPTLTAQDIQALIPVNAYGEIVSHTQKDGRTDIPIFNP